MDNASNALKDFDIALSLNERAVAWQLKRAWEVWTDSETGTPFEINAVSLNTRKQPTGTRLSARLVSPELSLDGDRLAGKEVGTTLTLLDGTLTYESGGEVIEVPLDNHRLFIRSLLQKRSVDWNKLYQHDADCADEVRKHVDQYKLGEGQFSIECLFLTLTGPDAQMSAHVSGPQLSIEAGARLYECINTWIADSGISGPNGLLLTAAVVPRSAKRAPSLAMADYLFRLNRAKVSGVANNLTHTIDYLGVAVGGRTLPDTTAAQDELTRRQGTWSVHHKADGSEGLFAGIMVLRKDLYIDHLHASLNKALENEKARMAEENRAVARKHPELDFLDEVRFVREGDSLFLRGEKHYAWKDNDLDLKLDKNLKLEIKLGKGAEARLDGLLHVHLDRDRTTSMNAHSRAKANRNTRIGGDLSFVIQGEGAKCSVVPKFKPTFTHVVTKDDDEGDTWAITQILTRIKNDWDVEVAGDWLTDSRNAIIAMLNGVFASVDMTMGNFAFIPPGEETFTFRKPEFNENLDLVIDVLYRGV